MNKARIIVGANYGDEGKGTVTARYARESGNALNILTNGGSQRGHTVASGLGRHTFQHFGSGSYFGAANYYSRFFILNPMQFVKEWWTLAVRPTVYRDPICRWTTPYDMMANAISRELKGTHDTCGMGIWNTIVRYRKLPILTLDEFAAMPYQRKSDYLDRVRSYYESGLQVPDGWKSLWRSEDMKRHFVSDCLFMVLHTTAEPDVRRLADRYTDLIFENGQGLLLCDTGRDTADTTPSDTGVSYSLEILADMGVMANGTPLGGSEVTVHYVTRPYLTRHGDGGMEDCSDRGTLSSGVAEDVSNQYNQFQGGLRYGWLDVGRLRDRILENAGGLPYEVELTHCDEMDRLSEFEGVFPKVNAHDRAEVDIAGKNTEL